MDLAFLKQNWEIYPEHFCEFAIGDFYDPDDEFACSRIALVDDEGLDREVMLQNTALISKAPEMFKLLIRSLHSTNDDDLKHDIQNVFDFIINHDFE